MEISVAELREIERAAQIAGAEAAMAEVVAELPSIIDSAVKAAVEAHKAAPAKATKPAYPSRRSSKPTLRAAA